MHSVYVPLYIVNWGYGQKFNGMPLCKLQVLAALCTPINGGSVVFDPLSLALVILIFNHCVHVLLGTCSGLKDAGAGPSPQGQNMHGCHWSARCSKQMLLA